VSISSPLPDFGAQIHPPVPARNSHVRRLPDEPAEASYLTNHVRLVLGGGAIDLVPTPGAVTARPSDRGLQGRLFVINAGYAPHVLATLKENLDRVESFRDSVRSLGWPFHAAVVFPVSRAWVELGVALVGVDELDLELLTRGRALPGVHVWDDDGLSFWPASAREPRLGPVPVSIRPVEPGCPMRLDERRQPCVPEGGPWVGAAVERRMWWEAHRQLMVSAFGCSVCGGRLTASGRAVALVECRQPSRSGGWAPGTWLEAPDQVRF